MVTPCRDTPVEWNRLGFVDRAAPPWGGSRLLGSLMMSQVFRTMLCLAVLLASYPAAVIGQATCRGTVVDAKGKPLADVAVRLYDVKVGMEGFKAELAAENTSGPDGMFTISHAPVEPGQPGSMGMILAYQPGLAIDWANWGFDMGDTRVKLTLGKPASLNGMVVDEAGTAVPGAEVGAFLAAKPINGQDQPRVTYGLPSVDWLVAKTDSTGRFSFDNLPPDCTAELLAWAPNRAKVFTLPDRGQDGVGQFIPGADGIRITLPPEAVIEGTVVDKEQGQRLSGIGVFLRGERAAGYMESSPVISGADGRFRFSALRPGNYQIDLVPAAGGSAWVTEPVFVSLGEGEAKTGIVFELSKAGVIEVLVTDAVTSEPVEDVSVWMTEQDGHRFVFGVTNKLGVAKIVAPPGRYVGDSLRRGQERVGTFNQEIAVAAGGVARLTVSLGKPPMLKGIVLDPDNKPVVNADLRFCPGAERVVRSDLKGLFDLPIHIEPWRAGRRGRLLLLVRQVQRHLAAMVELDANAVTTEVHLAPAATVNGRIVEPNGRAIPQAQVVISLLLEGGEPISIEVVESNKDGRFEAAGLPHGRTYRVQVSTVPGFGAAQRDIKIGVGQDRLEASDLVLPPADTSVSGVVVDEQGQPLAEVTISSQGPGQPLRHATSDSQGRFRLDGVCKGRVQLLVEAVKPRPVRGSGVFEIGAGALRIVVRQDIANGVPQPPGATSGPVPETPD